MKFYVFTFFLILNFSIFSQKAKKAERINVDQITLSQERQIDENKDYNFTLTTQLPFPTFYVCPSAFLIDLGADARFHSMKYGSINGSYYYSLLATELKGNPSYFQESNISQSNFTLLGDITLNKQTKDKPSLFAVVCETGKVYSTVYNSKALSKLNFRLGFSQIFSQTESSAYSDYLYSKYSDPRPVGTYGGDLTCWLKQSIKVLKFGLSHQKAYNSNFIAKDKNGLKYYGRNSSFFSFYYDVNLGLSSDLSPVNYTYSLYNEGSNIGYGDKIEEKVIMSDFVKFHKVGFSLGLEYSTFRARRKIFGNKISLEIGSLPGYFDNFTKSIYLNFKFIGIGFGSFSGRIYEKKDKKVIKPHF